MRNTYQVKWPKNKCRIFFFILQVLNLRYVSHFRNPRVHSSHTVAVDFKLYPTLKTSEIFFFLKLVSIFMREKNYLFIWNFLKMQKWIVLLHYKRTLFFTRCEQDLVNLLWKTRLYRVYHVIYMYIQ